MTQHRLNFIIAIFYYALILLIFYFTVKFILPAALPFIAAFLFAALLQKPINRLSGHFTRLPRKVTASAVLLVFIATVGTAAVFLISALLNETIDFIADISEYIISFSGKIASNGEMVHSLISRLPHWLQGTASAIYSRFLNDTPGFLLSLSERLSGPLMDSVGAIGSFAMKLPSAAAVILITVTAAFFIGVDYDGIRTSISGIIPGQAKKYYSRIRSCSADTVVSLLKTYAFLMLLTFSELAVGFVIMNLLGAGISHAVPVALIIALVDILPVLGVGTVLIPWAVIDLLNGMTSRAVMLLVLYGVILVVRNFLEPKLVGQRFGLHPALTLLAIYIGGKLFGFAGIFLLPLTLIVLRRLAGTGLFDAMKGSPGEP